MHMQKEELAIVVLLLFAAIAACVLLLISTDVPGAAYSADSKVGDVVHLEGLMVYKEMTASGGHITMTVKSEAGLVKVFVSASSDAIDNADATDPGNHVYVQGKVQDYKGEREILATSISIE